MGLKAHLSEKAMKALKEPEKREELRELVQGIKKRPEKTRAVVLGAGKEEEVVQMFRRALEAPKRPFL